MSKDQRLYSFEPEETKILKSLISSQRLVFRGYFSKISRYKISLLQRQQISLMASSHGAFKAIDSKHFISIYFLSLVHFQTVRESLVKPIKLQSLSHCKAPLIIFKVIRNHFLLNKVVYSLLLFLQFFVCDSLSPKEATSREPCVIQDHLFVH